MPKPPTETATLEVDVSAHTININMGEPCTNCGKPGATNGGLCLACVTKRLTQFIDIDPCYIASAKHDIVTNDATMSLATDWAQFPLDVRQRLTDIVANEHRVAITFTAHAGDIRSITFQDCNLTTVKHDVVADVVKVGVTLSFKQIVPDFRAQIATWAAVSAGLRITIEPMQPALLTVPAGRLD